MGIDPKRLPHQPSLSKMIMVSSALAKDNLIVWQWVYQRFFHARLCFVLILQVYHHVSRSMSRSLNFTKTLQSSGNCSLHSTSTSLFAEFVRWNILGIGFHTFARIYWTITFKACFSTLHGIVKQCCLQTNIFSPDNTHQLGIGGARGARMTPPEATLNNQHRNHVVFACHLWTASTSTRKSMPHHRFFKSSSVPNFVSIRPTTHAKQHRKPKDSKWLRS